MANNDAAPVEGINEAIAAVLTMRQSFPRVTDVKISETTGIKIDQVRRLMRGQRRFHVDEFEAIALALGMTPADVIAEAYARMAKQRARADAEHVGQP